MPTQQLLLGGGASEATGLAALFGVNPNSQTDFKIEPVAKTYCFAYQIPTNGYAGVPSSNSNGDGWFLTGLGKTDEDNRGMWKDASGTTIPQPTTTPIDSVVGGSSSNWFGGGTYGSYDYRNITNFSGSSNGAFINSGIAMALDSSPNGNFINCRFNNGFGSALGLVTMFYGAYNYFSYHHSPVLKVTCNSISRIFMPKGIYTVNSTTTVNDNYGKSGVVLYPTVHNYSTLAQLNSFFSGQTGTVISGSGIFEY